MSEQQTRYVIAEAGTGKLLVGLKQSRGCFGTTWDDGVFSYPNQRKPILYTYKERANAMRGRIPERTYIRKAKAREMRVTNEG